MQRLKSGLSCAGFRVLVDTADIGPAEVWRKRLADLIRQCDSVIFLISPSSVRSPDCKWELDQAERHAKRLFPIRIQETPDADIPGRLLRLNHVIAYPNDHSAPALQQLIEALLIDLSWLREHTSLEELAQRWMDAGEATSRLLRGADIDKAEQWRDRRPQSAPDLTENQRHFIAASRLNVEVTARRRTTFASAAALVAILIAVGMNEMRIAAGLSAFEARVTAEATSIIESLNTQNEAYALRRALHAYSAASQTLEKPPDVVWNALRLAYAQYRIESIATAPTPMLALTMLSDANLLALDAEGSLWSFDLTLQSPRHVAIELPLEDAQSHGISPSLRSIWARRGNVIRFHDLSGKLIPLSGDLKADEHTLFDAVPGCIAALQAGHVKAWRAGHQEQVPILDIDWPKQRAGKLKGIRVSENCDRLLLVGESVALLYQWKGSDRKPRKLDVSSGESLSTSPNIRFITSYFSNSREVGRYDVDSGSWTYVLSSSTGQRANRSQEQGVDEVIVTDLGALVTRVGTEVVVFDVGGNQSLQFFGSILPRLLALSPRGELLASYRISEKSLSVLRAGQTPLFETVVKDVNLPAKESISALMACGPEIAVGGDHGSAIVLDRRNRGSVSRRYDVQTYVRRIDCDGEGIALISSEHGVLDVRKQPAVWLPETLGMLNSYGGRTAFPDTEKGLVVVSATDVTRYSRDGAIIENIERASRDDDTTIGGGGAIMLLEPRRLLLLGESTKRRNGQYGARACAYIWKSGNPTRTVCKARPQAIRFSAGGFLDDTTIVGAGLGGYLSLMSMEEDSQVDVEGAPQIVPHAMVRLDETRFALSSLGGELHIWTRNGTLLQPSLSLPNVNGAMSIAADAENGEVLVASGRSVLRTVLSGPRLRRSACDALAHAEREARNSFAFCRTDRHRSPALLRVSSTPTFEPLK